MAELKKSKGSKDVPTIIRRINSPRFKKYIKEAEELCAELYYKTLISNIHTNKFGYSLSNATLVKRILNKQGTTPLIATGEFVRSIYRDGSFVGVSSGTHPKSGLSFAELSHILEYGRFDKSVPAFPYWEKTFEELRPMFEKIIKQKVDEGIKDIEND